jgi:uncharacterized protein
MHAHTTRAAQKLRIPFFGLWLIALLFAIRFQTSQFTTLALPDKLQDFLTLSLSVVIEALPFVLLGILLSVLVQVWLPEKWVYKLLPKQPVLRRFMLSFLGMFLPVCECGNVPLARGLMLKGFTPGESLTFLLAAPILNPITIITTQQAFPSDPTILFARIAGGFLIANIVGWIFSTSRKPDELLTPAFAKTCEVAYQDSDHRRGKVKRSLEVFAGEANAMLPALFVGSFAAGLIQVALPRSVLLGLGGHVVLSVIVMMLLAFVISICANVDAFFALAFASSFTTGAIVSFLVFGPIVDIKMLNLMRTTYKARVLAMITLITLLVSGFLGLAVNYAF